MKVSFGKISFSLIQAELFFCSVLIFVGFLQLPYPFYFLSLAGVMLAVLILSRELNSFRHILVLFDLKKFSGYAIFFLINSILLGIFLGLVFRNYLHITMLSGRLRLFSLTAMAIGMCEELIFRGYIQRKLRNSGLLTAIGGAAIFHTLYKCFVFMVIPPVFHTDFLWLVVLTSVVGCIMGLLKEFSGTTWVPMAGHATFDLIVYGDGMVAAWWVWL